MFILYSVDVIQDVFKGEMDDFYFYEIDHGWEGFNQNITLFGGTLGFDFLPVLKISMYGNHSKEEI